MEKKPDKPTREFIRRWFTIWDQEQKKMFALTHFYPIFNASAQFYKEQGFGVDEVCLLPYADFIRIKMTDRNCNDLVGVITWNIKSEYRKYIKKYYAE